MIKQRPFLLVASVAFISVLLVVLVLHKYPRDLRTKLHVENVDLGIPGISKVYGASITNYGLLPVRVTRCNFVSDTGTPGVSIAYAIQKWDDKTKGWRQVLGASRYCGELRAAWLWPGQSLSIGEEATAARDDMNIGDRVRFVIFTADPGDYSSSKATEEFTVDEHSTSDVDFRIRH